MISQLAYEKLRRLEYMNFDNALDIYEEFLLHTREHGHFESAKCDDDGNERFCLKFHNGFTVDSLTRKTLRIALFCGVGGMSIKSSDPEAWNDCFGNLTKTNQRDISKEMSLTI